MEMNIEVPVIDMQEVGERIKQLRKEKHLKVTDISDQMGFESPQAVYKWQRGECLPEILNLIILSRMLDTTVEGILLGDERDALPLFCEERVICKRSLREEVVMTYNILLYKYRKRNRKACHE